MLGLAFSGGKDSLACWYLYRARKPVVFWVNTGKAYPETLELIDEVRAESAHFVEVAVDQQAHIESHGLPSDLVPVDWTDAGQIFTGSKPVRVQPYLQCCASNIWFPLMRAAKSNGVTELVRGQRADEGHKATSVHGSVVDGIVFLHPVEQWTRTQVLDFILAQRGSLPDHYAIEHSSLDCYDCTAYVAHSADRVAWTKATHPDLYTKYEINMATLRSALSETVRLYA